MKIRVPGVYHKAVPLSSGGVTHCWYHRKTGTRIPHDPLTPEFMAMKRDLDAGKIKPTVATGSVAALIKDFRSSAEYARLAAGTRAEYDRHMNTIEAIVGGFAVSQIKLVHIAKVRDKFQATPAKANGVSRMFSRLLTYAVAPLGWITVNPCQKLKLMKVGSGQTPLLEAEIARFREKNPIGTRARLAFEICLATALRISDIVKVTRDQLGEMLIATISKKTGVLTVALPTAELRAAFDAWEKVCREQDVDLGIYALGTTNGEPLHKRTISEDLEAAYVSAEFQKKQRTHALRYTAATRLFEAGYSFDDIAEVTGHKMAEMAKKYCKKRRRGEDVRREFDSFDQNQCAQAALLTPPAAASGGG
jgi:integrase